MKLNLNFYKNKEELTNLEEQKLIKYILKEKECEDENHIKEMVALSKIKENILSWYPFKENSNILEIGANLGEITGVLCQNANRVVSIESSLQKAKAIETRYKEYVGNSLISSRSGGSFTFSWEFDGSTVYIDGSPEFTYRNGSLIDSGGNAFTK